MKEYTIKFKGQFDREFQTVIATDSATDAKRLYCHYATILYGCVKLVRTATDENLVKRTRYNKVWFTI